MALLALLMAFAAVMAFNRGAANAESASDEPQGTFVATLGALNTSANGGTAVTGTVTFTLSGDTFTADVNAHGLAPNTAHAMHIHTGNACPTASADTNNNGNIDVVEGVPAYGPILVPIDDNIANTDPAQGNFPMSDASGNLQFSTSGSLTALLNSLHEADPNPNDAFAKLSDSQMLDLAMRTVVIHGIAANATLPSNTGTLTANGEPHANGSSSGDLPPQATLPVACGTISQTAGGTPTPTTTMTPTATATPPADQNGTFTAVLGALNTQANGATAVTGTVTTTISGDTVTVVVDAHGLAPGIAHAMHFHVGDACPTAASDANGDGVIDVVEGVPAYGPILIPIDSDLANTDPNQGTFPTADANGDINFTTTASLSALMASLHEADPNPNDAFAKLTADQQLSILTRIVVIHGVANNTTLPSTTGTLTANGEPHANGSSATDLPPQATLPVACGTETAGNGSGHMITITLQGRWTLIGWVGADMSVGDALGNISSKVSVVWGFDNTTQTWHAYFPAQTNTPGANDLTSLQTGHGYFVDLNDPSTPVQWTITFADAS